MLNLIGADNVQDHQFLPVGQVWDLHIKLPKLLQTRVIETECWPNE